MFNLQFDTAALDDIGDAIKSIADSPFNLLGLEKDIESIIGANNDEIFNTRGGSIGQKWEELKDGSGRTPLDKTGQLRDAATHPKVTAENGGMVLAVTFSGPHSFLIPIHSSGFEVKRTGSKRGAYTIKVPARPMTILSQASIDQITQLAFKKLTADFGQRLKGKRR